MRSIPRPACCPRPAQRGLIAERSGGEMLYPAFPSALRATDEFKGAFPAFQILGRRSRRHRSASPRIWANASGSMAALICFRQKALRRRPPCMRRMCSRFVTYDVQLDTASQDYCRNHQWRCRSSRNGSPAPKPSPTSSRSSTSSSDVGRLSGAFRYRDNMMNCPPSNWRDAPMPVSKINGGTSIGGRSGDTRKDNHPWVVMTTAGGAATTSSFRSPKRSPLTATASCCRRPGAIRRLRHFDRRRRGERDDLDARHARIVVRAARLTGLLQRLIGRGAPLLSCSI